MAPTHNIKPAIYKDTHTHRVNTCVFGLYLTKIEISLLFFSLLFQEKWVWVYIFLGLFVCDGGLFVCYGGLMTISNQKRRWTDLVWGFTKREGRLIWFGGRWINFGFLVLIWGVVRVTCE